MQSPQPMLNILYHEYLLIKRRSKEIYFSQRLFTTYFSQRLSHNVLLTTSFTQRLPTTSFSHRCPNIFVHMRSPYNVTIYVCSFCAVQMSQNIRNSLKFKPGNFDKFRSIKLTPRRCTSAIYILSLCEV